ncbi:MAG: hypothetical protein U0X20_11375 [Caldilineaceae bacterium]
MAGSTFNANMGVLYTGDLGSTAIAEGGALAAFAVDTMAVAAMCSAATWRSPAG